MAAGLRRKVQGRDDAVALLHEYAESHLKFRDFCRKKGVDGRSLRPWRSHLAPSSPQPVRLVELVTRPQQVPTRYRIHVGDLMVEVDDTFRSETLTRLLDVVAPC